MGLPANIIGIVNKIYYDVDALAFINAAGITNFTQKSAINSLVLGLKNNSLWTKCIAVYPMVGGTATTHKFNLKNPADTNAAFRLSFLGGWTHNSNGATGNGTSAWANTFINALSNLTQTNMHVSYYSRTASAAGTYPNELGLNGTYVSANTMALRVNNRTSPATNSYFAAGNDAFGAVVSNTLNGFFMGIRPSSADRRLLRNGSQTAINTTANSNSMSSLNISINGTATANYSANNCAFVSIGDGMTNAEAAIFYNIVQTYQTTLGRQV